MTARTEKRIVDTNVPATANLAVDTNSLEARQLPCVLACVKAIESVVNRGGLVIDAGDEIFDEYRANLSMAGQPGVGDHFLKWVHDHRWGFPDEDRVPITRAGDSYEEFPEHPALSNFDPSDRKFVAVANNHPAKPHILEATDSK
ncbi:MAG: hypothetical protein R3E01_16060 [Pirellulaceae bacterium]|nr:hypothetical protein [Planctomycetales bacterium]